MSRVIKHTLRLINPISTKILMIAFLEWRANAMLNFPDLRVEVIVTRANVMKIFPDR